MTLFSRSQLIFETHMFKKLPNSNAVNDNLQENYPEMEQYFFKISLILNKKIVYRLTLQKTSPKDEHVELNFNFLSSSINSYLYFRTIIMKVYCLSCLRENFSEENKKYSFFERFSSYKYI